MGQGLGASSVFTRLGVWGLDKLAPNFVAGSPYWSNYIGDGQSPLFDFIVFEVVGVALGGFVSGWLSHRLKISVDKGPRISKSTRYAFALGGGILAGFGARFGPRMHQRPGALRRRRAVGRSLRLHDERVCCRLYRRLPVAEELAMNAPYVDGLSPFSFVLLSLVIGFFFGFFLERAGFSSAKKLTDQFYFKDFSVLKVMFTAIIVAMLGIAYLSFLGWLNFGQVYVPGTFLWPQLFGGLLLGGGFILGGYCPGTSVVAAAIGKIDGLLFVLGVAIGTFGFGFVVPGIKSFYLSGALGPLTIPQWLNINAGVAALLVTLAAVGAFWAAEKSEGPWRLFKKTYGKGLEGDVRQ